MAKRCASCGVLEGQPHAKQCGLEHLKPTAPCSGCGCTDCIHEHNCPNLQPGMVFREPQYDPVNRPAHYNPDSPYEPIKIIEAMGWGADYCRGNALKYLLRAGKKEGEPELKDLKKCRWYINRLVEHLEKQDG